MEFQKVGFGILILGMSLTFGTAHAEEAIKTQLLIKSVHPDGTPSEHKMDIVSSTPEEVAAIIAHFTSQVNVPPSDPDDDTIVSVDVMTE